MNCSILVLLIIFIINIMAINALASSIQESYYMYIRVSRGGYVRVWTNETPLVFNEDLVIKFRYVTVGYGTLSMVLYYEDPVTYSVLAKYVEGHLIINKVMCTCSNNVLEPQVRPDVENVLIIKIRSDSIEITLNGIKLINCNITVPRQLRLAIVVKSAPNSDFSVGFLDIITTTDGMEAIPKGWAIVKVGNADITYLGRTIGIEVGHQPINPILLVGVFGVIFIAVLVLSKRFLRRTSW